MSYNILKKNVRFSGDTAGTIEGMVDTSSDQIISGSKEFQHLTGSNAKFLNQISAQSASFAGTVTLNNNMTIATGKRIYLDGTGVPANQGPFIYGSLNTMYIDGDDNMYLYHDTRMSIFHGSNRVIDINGGAIGVDTTISSSNYISASAFIGNGSQLTNLGEAGSVAASNIVGNVIATQVSHSSPLTASGDNLTVSLASSRGIVNDSGLALDVGNLPNAPAPSYDDSYNIIISGSGAVKNKRVSLSWLESGIELGADRITGGTLDNARLPTNINVSRVSASIGVSASFYATAGGTVIDADGNFQGNNASFNEITASSVISSSAEISASSFHGDGSGLFGIRKLVNYNGNITLKNSYVDNRIFNFASGDAAITRTSIAASDSERSKTTFIAPASGTLRQVSVTTFGAGAGNVDVHVGIYKNGDYNSPVTHATGSLKPAGGNGGRQLPTLGNNFTNTFDMTSGSGTPLSPGSANVFVSGTVPFSFNPNDSVHFIFGFADGNNSIASSINIVFELDDTDIP